MGHNDVFRDSNCKVEEVGKNKKRWRKVKVRHSRERWDLMWCQDNFFTTVFILYENNSESVNSK